MGIPRVKTPDPRLAKLFPAVPVMSPVNSVLVLSIPTPSVLPLLLPICTVPAPAREPKLSPTLSSNKVAPALMVTGTSGMMLTSVFAAPANCRIPPVIFNRPEKVLVPPRTSRPAPILASEPDPLITPLMVSVVVEVGISIRPTPPDSTKVWLLAVVPDAKVWPVMPV